MIIYGYRGTHFDTQPLYGIPCPHCGTGGKLRVSLISQYAHVYWIPLFPYKKVAVLHCDACYTDWEELGWAPEAAAAVRDIKAQARPPYWTWSGVVLIAAAVAFGVFSSVRNTHNDEALLEYPRAGDIYTVRSDSSTTMYSLLKVQQVSGNTVVLVANEYQTTNTAPIEVLNDSAKYSKEPFILTRLDLQIMRRQDQLTDVDRMK